MAGKSGFARPPPTDVDPFSPLSGQISPTSSGHIITAHGPVIMSALLDLPADRQNRAERPLPFGSDVRRGGL